MPRDLRKRKAPTDEPAAPQPAIKKKAAVVKAITTVKESPPPSAPASKSAKTNSPGDKSKVTVGKTIKLEGFGGEIETLDGMKTTLQELVEKSIGGVVLFTYPKASTPGCTTQACLFRDRYASLTATGFSIFGLSKDSPKANTNFKAKLELPYPLLCDPSASLITAIGLKKAPSGTKRGVFVVDKSATVLAAEPGGPAATVDVVQKIIDQSSIDVPETNVDAENCEPTRNDSTSEKPE